MPDYTPLYGDLVKFKEAINFFKQKSLLPSDSYKELQGLIHSKAFTVAGAAKIELLNDLYTDVSKFIDNGETITDFRKRFDTTVAKHGWSYNGKRGWRTQTIYQNNKNTARAAGRWQQQLRTASTRPYLLYLTAGDERVRDEHRKWNYILLPIEHEFWSTHYPPNGWGCRCKVMAVNDRDIERMGLTITSDKALSKYMQPIESIDKTTGELTTKLSGIDSGWDYNPGKGWLGADSGIGKSIVSLNNELREAVIPSLNRAIVKSESHFTKTIMTAAAKKARGLTPDLANKITIGHLSNEIINRAFSKRAGLFTSAVYIDESVIINALNSGVQFEVLTKLMTYLHMAKQFTVSDGTVTITHKQLLFTILLERDFNRVVSVESV